MIAGSVEVILNEEDQQRLAEMKKKQFLDPPNMKHLLSFTHHVAAGDEGRRLQTGVVPLMFWDGC